jgi:hypothetical protein
MALLTPWNPIPMHETTHSDGLGKLTEPLVLDSAEDARHLAMALKNGRSYTAFRKDMCPHGIRSTASLHGWCRGYRVPTLERLIKLAEIAGARVVIEPVPAPYRQRKRPETLSIIVGR